MLRPSELVKKFQEELEISRKNAIWRVSWFIFGSLCLITALTFAVVFFPYASKFEEKISMIPGKYVQAEEIPQGDVFVNRVLFIEETKRADALFVSLDKETVIYMAKVGGLKYCYRNTIPLNYNPCGKYFIYSQQIQGEFIVREIKRNKFATVFIPFAELFFIFLICLFIGRIQQRRVSGYGDRAVYNVVWI